MGSSCFGYHNLPGRLGTVLVRSAQRLAKPPPGGARLGLVGCGCFLGRPQNLGSLGFGAPPPGGEVRLGLGLLGFCARADWSPPPPGRWEHSALGLRPRGFMGKLCYEQGCPPLLGEARQANGSGLWLFRLGGLFHGCPPSWGEGSTLGLRPWEAWENSARGHRP